MPGVDARSRRTNSGKPVLGVPSDCPVAELGAVHELGANRAASCSIEETVAPRSRQRRSTSRASKRWNRDPGMRAVGRSPSRAQLRRCSHARRAFARSRGRSGTPPRRDPRHLPCARWSIFSHSAYHDVDFVGYCSRHPSAIGWLCRPDQGKPTARLGQAPPDERNLLDRWLAASRGPGDRRYPGWRRGC